MAQTNPRDMIQVDRILSWCPCWVSCSIVSPAAAQSPSPFMWWKGETTCNYSVALLDVRASVGRKKTKKKRRDRVTSLQTYICHFVGWYWTAAVWSFSWWARSLPHSHLRSRQPRHLEVPTEAGATAARAPWLPWERKRQKRWMETQESPDNCNTFWGGGTKKNPKHLRTLTAQALTSVWAQDSGIKHA